MLKDVKWAPDGTYRPDEEFSPERFFNDGLKNSSDFDLELGYFSSATISVLAEGFATFISHGGTMRLIINQIVTDKDKVAISNGVLGNVIECVDLTNFEELKKTFDEYQTQFFNCLSYLIHANRIQIEIIRPRNKKGIAHTKCGQFRDGDSITSFTGSANFTISGLFNNIEEIKIDRSDSPDVMTQNRITSQQTEFESIMSHVKDNVDYLSPDDLITAVRSNFERPDIDELLNAEVDLAALREQKKEKQREEELFAAESIGPAFPYSEPREYQKQAFENWKANRQRGLFAMATGTGKTITSLNCLLQIYFSNRYYKAIILVPTVTLVDQWERECWKFHFEHIIKISSKNREWKSQLTTLSISERLSTDPTENNYIIISTYRSFSDPIVFDKINVLPRKRVLLIADEAHNMGAKRIKDLLPKVNILRRIGLSATPERQYDDEGNKAVNDFFGVEGLNYTFEYSMEEAIENGVLCRYEYYPHLIELTDPEMDAYTELTEKISNYLKVNGDDASFKNDKILTALLLKRKRIVHKAVNKKEKFREILQNRYDSKGNLKYTLVYVPEGNEPDYPDYSLKDTVGAVDEDHLIDDYTEIVSGISKEITVKEFTSGSKDRDYILNQFADGKLDVLTSMKCLDEGVDVPRSEMAIFCASTGNPRQFIQRRGRILRTHPDKHRAIIHDLVVAPKIDSSEASFETERALLKSELKRVQNFALLSENSSDSVIELEDVINFYNLSIFDDFKNN